MFMCPSWLTDQPPSIFILLLSIYSVSYFFHTGDRSPWNSYFLLSAETKGVHSTCLPTVPKVIKLGNWRIEPESAQYPDFLLGPKALDPGILISVQPVGSWIALSGPLYLLTAPSWPLVCPNCRCSLGLTLYPVNCLILSNIEYIWCLWSRKELSITALVTILRKPGPR